MGNTVRGLGLSLCNVKKCNFSTITWFVLLLKNAFKPTLGRALVNKVIG